MCLIQKKKRVQKNTSWNSFFTSNVINITFKKIYIVLLKSSTIAMWSLHVCSSRSCKGFLQVLRFSPACRLGRLEFIHSNHYYLQIFRLDSGIDSLSEVTSLASFIFRKQFFFLFCFVLRLVLVHFYICKVL